MKLKCTFSDKFKLIPVVVIAYILMNLTCSLLINFSAIFLFSYVRAGLILTSLLASCKISVISRNLLYVMQHHKLCENDVMWC